MHYQTRPYFRTILYALLILLLAGCSSNQTLRGVFQQQTPHERYSAKIKDLKLDDTAMGRDWLLAGNKALQDSITITLPFKETGYFAADNPRALGYRFAAKRGEKIVINLEITSRQQLQVFMDVFEESESGTAAPSLVASADTATSQLQYEISEDRQHILRIQPELLQSGQYIVTVHATPALAFPVQGKSSRNIASLWGDARDAGARSHEGIDIFAKRGTPALAATAGTVSGVGTNGLGGKVVWLTDETRRQRLYYAHLDKQLVTMGQRVQQGDTIGLIGNTGNARSTNPHLHFGIYRFGYGAINPYPYVHQQATKAPAVKIDASKIGNWVRVTAKQANVRLQPSSKGKLYASIPEHTPLQVMGGVSEWYRVKLPDGAEGYIAAGLVEPITKQIRAISLITETQLLDEAHPKAASKDRLNAGSQVALLGAYGNFKYVRSQKGDTGWIYTSNTLQVL